MILQNELRHEGREAKGRLPVCETGAGVALRKSLTNNVLFCFRSTHRNASCRKRSSLWCSTSRTLEGLPLNWPPLSVRVGELNEVAIEFFCAHFLFLRVPRVSLAGFHPYSFFSAYLAVLFFFSYPTHLALPYPNRHVHFTRLSHALIFLNN